MIVIWKGKNLRSSRNDKIKSGQKRCVLQKFWKVTNNILVVQLSQKKYQNESVPNYIQLSNVNQSGE